MLTRMRFIKAHRAVSIPRLMALIVKLSRMVFVLNVVEIGASLRILQRTYDLTAPLRLPRMTISDTVMVMSQRNAAEASNVVMA